MWLDHHRNTRDFVALHLERVVAEHGRARLLWDRHRFRSSAFVEHARDAVEIDVDPLTAVIDRRVPPTALHAQILDVAVEIR